MLKVLANRPISRYYFGSDAYDSFKLGVYLVSCQPRQNIQSPVVLPILAPLWQNSSIRDRQGNKVPHPHSEGYYSFSTETYIKASAKTIVSKLNPEPKDPHVWKPDSYKFSSVRMNLGSLQDCIDDGKRGISTAIFLSQFYGFNDMVANYFMDEGTLPVTFESLKDVEIEVEEPIEDDLESKIAMLAPPATDSIN